jgi:hypothetical protein
MHIIFLSENLKGRDHSEDIGSDGKIMLKWILGEIGWEGVDWMHLAQDRDQWQGLVNTEMDLWFPRKAGNLF